MEPTLNLIPESEATGKVAELYNRVKEVFQIPFVPNFVRAQAGRPDLLEPIWNCNEGIVVQEGKIPRPIKEMILMAVSNANTCEYCEAAHEVFCKALAVEPETRKQIIEDLDNLRPGRIRDIIEFAKKAACLPSALKEDDYQNLRKYGITDEEIQEIVTCAAWATFCNIIAESLKVPKDQEFGVALSTDS